MRHDEPQHEHDDTRQRQADRIGRLLSLFALGTAVAGTLACGGGPPPPKGRVVRIGGRTQMASVRAGTGWSDGRTPASADLSEEERELAAAGWILSGLLEHAAVAAFSDVAYRLIQLGAPSELVAASLAAAEDEVRHARRCFALASHYLGEEVCPGRFDALARAERPADARDALVRLAVGSLRDGALGEGVAASTAAASARRVTDPLVRETFATIAREEAEHAELAWEILRWALATDEAVAPALESALLDLERHVAPARPDLPGHAPERLAELGLLPQAELGRLAVEGVAATRARCRRLLETPSLRRAG